MKEKKTAVITFRTEEWVKDLLQEAADQNKWSIAQTVNVLCKKFVANPHPETITIRIQDLVNIIEELKKEGTEKATQLCIDIKPNEDETKIIKTLSFEVLECGGRGCIGGFDSIEELSEAEISNIP